VAEFPIVPYKCAYCNGSGLIRGKMQGSKSDCPGCGGVGYKNGQSGAKICIACKGLGRERLGLTQPQPCTTCNGLGWIIPDE